MQLSYGQLSFSSCQLIDWTQTAVWDGPTYLYHKNVIHVRGVLNPGYIQTDLDGKNFTQVGIPFTSRDFGPVDARVLQPGQNLPQPEQVIEGGAIPLDAGMSGAAFTKASIQQYMLQPRRQFMLQQGTTVCLYAPQLDPDPAKPLGTAYKVDVANGPMPISCKVVESIGIKTMIIDYQIEITLNDCDLFASSSSASALLSHRWTTHDRISREGYTTRTIQGHAIFRTDRLVALAGNPGGRVDDYRAWIFTPCAPFMYRDSVDVQLFEDGTGFFYNLVDIERPIGADPNVMKTNFITKIEGYMTSAVTVGGMADAAAAVVGQFLGGDVGTPDKGRSRAKPASPNAMIMSLGGGILRAVRGLIPSETNSVVVRVWGDRNATRLNMAGVAISIILQALSQTGRDLLTAGTSVMVSADLMNEFVEVRADMKTSIATDNTLRGKHRINAGGLAGIGPVVANENINILGRIGDVSPVLPNDPIPGTSQGARGWFDLAAITQALQGPCATSAQPTIPPEFTAKVP